MFALDRSSISKYTRARLDGSTISSTISLKSDDAPITEISTVSTTTTLAGGRLASTSSMGRPYATQNERRVSLLSNSLSSGRPGSSSINRPSAFYGAVRKTQTAGSRQSSEDSGIEDATTLEPDNFKYILPPRITSYAQSEFYLMNLPRCEQFLNHLVRYLRPILSELKLTSRNIKAQVESFAPKLHKLTQELIISFPRSASLVATSPRFQEFLALAVENVVMRFAHDQLFPVICYLSQSEDRELLSCASYMNNQIEFSADQLGLSEDYWVPLFAAVVELASLDMRTTPLDRLTCFYDTVEQIRVHIKEAIAETRPFRKDPIPDPNDHDLVLLLATVIVQARPVHLMSTLNYADLFAWSVPIDMIEVVTLMSSAAEFVRNIQPKELLPSSGKLKREMSKAEVIELTGEVQQNFDRKGKRLEPLKSALDLHRERFAQRLEKSSADRTRRQEEAWARLDRCTTPIQENNRVKRGLLSTIHTKLICSTDPNDVAGDPRL